MPATFDLSAYAGKTIGLQFRYTTDANTGGYGFFADEIKVTSGRDHRASTPAPRHRRTAGR